MSKKKETKVTAIRVNEPRKTRLLTILFALVLGIIIGTLSFFIKKEVPTDKTIY